MILRHFFFVVLLSLIMPNSMTLFSLLHIFYCLHYFWALNSSNVKRQPFLYHFLRLCRVAFCCRPKVPNSLLWSWNQNALVSILSLQGVYSSSTSALLFWSYKTPTNLVSRSTTLLADPRVETKIKKIYSTIQTNKSVKNKSVHACTITRRLSNAAKSPF